MRTLHILILELAASILAFAQSPSAAPPLPAPPPEPSELQRQSIAKMRQSIALQKVSVEKQVASAVRSFFLLPPLEEGFTSAAPQGPMAFADCAPLPDTTLNPIVAQAATAQSLDPDLLRSVIRQESAFRPCSVSSKGAMGLMQLMPATVEQFGVREPFEPIQNVEAGARFLKALLARYNGDLSRALAAYNAGPAAVDAAGAVPQYPETIDYVKKILSNLPAKKD
jgi:soluble lytic murein transglycosylase-like protein